ncbi:MAG TPA: TonB-dependent receptor [Candidatus Acidoferrales bacterium]|nr:TonB-dependent receptor [Candidatus Acidoferrales bacterium]
MWRRRELWAVVLFAAMCAPAGPMRATVFGTVRGIVHDPQHRPVAGAKVELRGTSSGVEQTAESNANGEFTFDAVPLGEYTIEATAKGFAAERGRVTVLSGSAPVVHLQLQIAARAESVTVSAEAIPVQAESVTPTTILDRKEIANTPGAGRANSQAMILDYVPGAYFTHDQLHVRGGHQVSWLIDGVAIPNTNIASNVGPQIAPRDIDTIEMQSGSYAADYGDRTYGIFDVAPRTGFESNRQGELVLTAGNFYQTDNQLNFGDHTSRFAYYASLDGNRTNLGLQTPTSKVLHDAANGIGGFTSLVYNATPNDQLRFVGQVRRDFYQVPFDPNDPNNDPGEFLSDVNVEKDGFAVFSWVHTFGPGLLFTFSPFFHYNSADYGGSALDQPSTTTEDRTSKYEGGQATISWVKKGNNLRAGLYGFAQQDSDLFGLVFHDMSGTPPLQTRVNPTGGLVSFYAEDQLRVTSWLTVSGGLRQTHFSGGVVENATDPRVGIAVRIPRLNWVFRAFYGHYYQAPPLATISGPLLAFITSVQDLDFLPLRGERDEEHQFGVTIPWKGWTLDADTFLTRAKNFFDHSNLNDSNVFIPVDLQGARINAWELTLRSPRILKRGQLYVTYSNQLAQGFGEITGGLIGGDDPDGYFLLDHDQRNTLHFGGSWQMPWRSFVSTDVYYGSGFTNDDSLNHLDAHTTFDMSLGKDFGENLSVSVQGLNVGNRRVMLDNSFTFGGTHYINPREIYAQVRWRFHY